MTSHYLNSDLLLVSTHELTPLIEALDPLTEVLHSDRGDDDKWYATIEAMGSGEEGGSPQRDIESLISAIQSLGDNVLELFVSCDSREVNIGWQSAPERPEGCMALTPDLLAKLGQLGITLGMTIYPSSEDDTD